MITDEQKQSHTNRTKFSSKTEIDNAIGVDREGSEGKRPFKRKRKYYECRSTDHWQKKCSKQKNHRQNETGKSISSQGSKKSDTKMSVNIVEKSNDKDVLNNESNIDDNANWMSTSMVMQDDELKGGWNLEAKKEHVKTESSRL